MGVKLVPICSISSDFSPFDVSGSHGGKCNKRLPQAQSGEEIPKTSRNYFIIRQVRFPEFWPCNLSSILPSTSSSCMKIKLAATASYLSSRLSEFLHRHPADRLHFEYSNSPDKATGQDSGSRDAQQSRELGTAGDSPIYHSPPQPAREKTNTRFHTGSHNSDEGTPPEETNGMFRSFNTFGRPKSVREINEAIKTELLRPYPDVEGFIYGFSHPENTFVKFGTGRALQMELLKIGRSDNIERRMRQWRKQCKYVPRLVFAHAMPQHYRIERVIHHQLHNARLREYLGCSGCGARHKEWFRVKAEYAQSLVATWRGFTEQQPYDELGNMLPDWLKRLEKIDLADPDCWSRFTRGLISTQPVSTQGTLQGLEDSTYCSFESETVSSSDGRNTESTE